jgi:hypothetical protein
MNNMIIFTLPGISTNYVYSTNGTSWTTGTLPAGNIFSMNVTQYWQNITPQSSMLADFSVTSPSNDQILVYTTASSLNKWTPYTISGATFNDSTKTITISSGSTALSGCTDVSISSPSNDQLLLYTTNGSLNKWTPYSLSGATFNDSTNTITISIGSYALMNLTDCILYNSANQVIQNNGNGLWQSFTGGVINVNEANTLSQMYNIYGGTLTYGFLTGSGIAQNSYFTLPSYSDNTSSGSAMLQYQSNTYSYASPASFTTNYNAAAISIGGYGSINGNNGSGVQYNGWWRINALRGN